MYRDYVNSILAGSKFEADDGTQGGNNSQGQDEENNDNGGEGAANGDDGDGTDKGGKSTKTYTEDELQTIIKDRLERERAKSKADAEEADKLKKMNADQKAKYELDKLKQELAEARAANARNEMTKAAREQLTDTGIALSDEELSLIVTTEAESTKANCTTLAALVTRVREDERQKYLGGKTPNVPGGKSLSAGEAAATARNAEKNVENDPWKQYRN